VVDFKMPDVNSVMIAGNLTGDPSFRRTSNGTPVTNFHIASNRRYKDNNGQWRDNVCYIGVVAWYKLAESCAENLHKSNAVLVDGELQSRNWKNEDGSTRNVVEIKARRIQFLNKRTDEHENAPMDSSAVTLVDSQEEPRENKTDAEKQKTPEENLLTNKYNFGYDNLKL